MVKIRGGLWGLVWEGLQLSHTIDIYHKRMRLLSVEHGS